MLIGAEEERSRTEQMAPSDFSAGPTPEKENKMGETGYWVGGALNASAAPRKPQPSPPSVKLPSKDYPSEESRVGQKQPSPVY